jgi:rsbT antagonist protein RsbS
MTVPILKQNDFLIASVQSALSDTDIRQLQENLLDLVGKHRSRGVIVDVGAMDVIDTYATRSLRAVARSTKLRGAEMVVVGIQPEVAFAMVQFGLTLDDINTALDLEEGMDLLERLTEGRGLDDER